MKQPAFFPAPSQASSYDTLPAAGGSYLRQPDGSLERVVATSRPPAAEEPIDPVPTSGAKE